MWLAEKRLQTRLFGDPLHQGDLLRFTLRLLINVAGTRLHRHCRSPRFQGPGET